MPPPLPQKLKKAATDSFQDNVLLADVPLEDRERAAQWYEDVAREVGGIRAGLARSYNLERAKFLRGQVPRIAPDAPAFGREIGHQETGG